MTYGGAQVYAPQNRPRKVFSKNLLANTALAAVAIASGWIICVNLLGDGAETFESKRVDTLQVQPAAFEIDTAEATFEERFGPFGTAPPPSPEIAKNYFALLDPSHDFGAPAGSFVKDVPAPPVQTAARVKDIETQHAQTDAPLSPAVRDAMHTIPLPLSRPREIAHEIAQAGRTARTNVASKAANIFEKLFGKSDDKPTRMAYASADAGVDSKPDGGLGQMPMYDRDTAVYDISARAVYLPSGTKLEAHSGLGSKIDDPRFVHVRMSGATPPHLYDLKLRESLFHGVEALRLNPVGGEEAIYGRNGLLAHTYMLGPNGDSNGCVSFKDYDRFLQAYKNGEIKRLAVIAKVE